MEEDHVGGCPGREHQHAYTQGLAGERYYGPDETAYRAGRQEAQRRREAEDWRECIARHTQGRLW